MSNVLRKPAFSCNRPEIPCKLCNMLQVKLGSGKLACFGLEEENFSRSFGRYVGHKTCSVFVTLMYCTSNKQKLKMHFLPNTVRTCMRNESLQSMSYFSYTVHHIG